jgi:putative endonuclease
MTSKKFFVYILTNKNKTVLYIGITNNLERRISEHKADAEGSRKSFCGRYNCYFLIYYEEFQSPLIAISREKELKGWSRKKKESLIISDNPNWIFIQT